MLAGAALLITIYDMREQRRQLQRQVELQAATAVIEAQLQRIADAKAIIETILRDSDVPLRDQAFMTGENVFDALVEALPQRLPEDLRDEAKKQFKVWETAAVKRDKVLAKLDEHASELGIDKEE